MRLLMHIFTETTTSDESWAVSSSILQFPNILLDGWEGLKAYTFEKRQSKGAHFEIFFHRASRGAAWPLHFKFASYAYDL